MPFPRNVFHFLDQNDAYSCILRTVFLLRDAYATYRHNVVYTRIWCLYLCYKVTRRRFINADERIVTQSTDN